MSPKLPKIEDIRIVNCDRFKFKTYYTQFNSWWQVVEEIYFTHNLYSSWCGYKRFPMKVATRRNYLQFVIQGFQMLGNFLEGFVVH